MLKLSFNKTQYYRKEGDVTVCTILASFSIPEILGPLPNYLANWLVSYNGVKLMPDFDKFYVEAKAKTTKLPEDTEDSVKATHIAESKAKLILYKFMYNLTNRILDHHYKITGIDTTTSEEDLSVCNTENTLLGAYLQYRHLVYTEENHLKQLMVS